MLVNEALSPTQKLKSWPPTIAPQNFNFSLSPEEKKYNFDLCIHNYILNHKDIQIHARGRVISITSQLFLTLWNSQSVIKYFGLHYAPDIQRWGFNPTVQIFLHYLGGITSPLFSVSYIKAPEHHFLLFSSQFIIFRASKHPNSSPTRSVIIFSKEEISTLLKDYKDQFALLST